MLGDADRCRVVPGKGRTSMSVTTREASTQVIPRDMAMEMTVAIVVTVVLELLEMVIHMGIASGWMPAETAMRPSGT